MLNGFVSYAHKDELDMIALVEPLSVALRVNRIKKARLWDDRQLLVGLNYWVQLAERLEESDFGYMLLSRNFLASEVCSQTELKHFLEEHKQIIPVALGHINFDEMDLGELQHIQCFFLRLPGQKPRAWIDCDTRLLQEHFVDQLLTKSLQVFQ